MEAASADDFGLCTVRLRVPVVKVETCIQVRPHAVESDTMRDSGTCPDNGCGV